VADELNPSQRAAVEHDLGPLLVLAGAGSGKTRVVTARIARLLSRGVHAKNMLAMTFTNKAAAEMLERVAKLVGHKVARDLTIGTFHHFGLGVLRAESRALGFRGGRFVIFDQADQSGVVREVLRSIRSDKGYDIGAILGRISMAKNAFVEPEDYEKNIANVAGASEYDEITALVYPRYLAMMRGFQAFDFDDLICEVVRLWKRRPEVLEKWQKRYRYLIVDEYQDTNAAQLELLLALGGGHKNVCVVGDDDQSIYAWRGADVRNILEFERHFEGAKIVKLMENYRSRASILAVAAVVLEKSGAKRHQKTIVSTRPEGDKVRLVVCGDSEVEAKFVAREIDRLITSGVRHDHIAVLYRSNLQAPEIETALKELSVPAVVLGGTQFFERKEVKDLCAYLKVAFDPMDELSLRRIINYPARGIGDAALERLSEHATAMGTSLWTAVTRSHAVQNLSQQARDGCRDLVRIIEHVRDATSRGETSMKTAELVCDLIDLKKDIVAGSTSNAAAARRWANVEGLLRVFGRRDDKGKGGPEDFAEFLRIIALRDSGDDEHKGQAVTLTTMHGAKGLEFDYVFLVGLEEGLLPHVRTTTERATDVPMGDASLALEEERRLFYVAVTRARERLYLCRAEKRLLRGKPVARVPSRFLVEIPEELLEKVDEKADPADAVKATVSGVASLLAALGGPPGASPAAPGAAGGLPLRPGTSPFGVPPRRPS